MRDGKRVFTIQVKEAEFLQRFNQYIAKGMDVLYIGCSSGLSGSVKTGKKIADDLMKEHPEAKLVVVDPLASGMGQGLIGIYAAQLRSQGKTIEETVEILNRDKLKYNQWGTVNDLNYLKRAGRVKATSAFFGNLFGVKPIIISDIHGANFAYKKVKGRHNSLVEIAESVKNTIVDPENHYIAITDAECEDAAKEVRSLIEERVKCKGILMSKLGPILGASCGPETLIVFNYGKEVTIEGK